MTSLGTNLCFLLCLLSFSCSGKHVCVHDLFNPHSPDTPEHITGPAPTAVIKESVSTDSLLEPLVVVRGTAGLAPGGQRLNLGSCSFAYLDIKNQLLFTTLAHHWSLCDCELWTNQKLHCRATNPTLVFPAVSRLSKASLVCYCWIISYKTLSLSLCLFDRQFVRRPREVETPAN